MEIRRAKTKTTVTLPKESTAYQLDEAKEALVEAVVVGKPISINASKVERIDTLFCQLLLSCFVTAKSKELEFEIVKPSEQCSEVFETIGVMKAIAEYGQEKPSVSAEEI